LPVDLVRLDRAIPVAGCVGSRKPRTSTSAQRPAAQIPEASGRQQHRPAVACWALSACSRGPGSSEDHQAGDAVALASRWFPSPLALEVPTARRSAADSSGDSPPDLFLVPTISFRLLYGFLILRHSRRELLWVGVTAHPNAEWIARQLTEAYVWRQAPRYIIRDRDRVYGRAFLRRIRAMGIRDRPIAPRSPWQNGCAERLIGSIRRECRDHVVVFGERHLRHLLKAYQKYYNKAVCTENSDTDVMVMQSTEESI
jgi:transposase InsO family protein